MDRTVYLLQGQPTNIEVVTFCYTTCIYLSYEAI
jgi:hypothetical protein